MTQRPRLQIKKGQLKKEQGRAAPTPNPAAAPEPGHHNSQPTPPAAPTPTASRPARPTRPARLPERQGDEAPAHRPHTQRLFYALRVPSEVAAPLAEVQRHLRGNWRAVNPGQMHVTLLYLPAVPRARVDDLKRLGTRLMADLPPLQISLRGTGYFPNEGSPRVWFAKVEAEGLGELAAELRLGVQALDIESDDLPFKAHITLARKKGPAPRVPPLLLDHLGWTATGGTLYRSILRKTGPIYEVESTFRFRGTSPPPNDPPMHDDALSLHLPAPPQELP